MKRINIKRYKMFMFINPTPFGLVAKLRVTAIIIIISSSSSSR